MEGIIEVLLADITKIKVDAIVNAANSSLLGGRGVDGAIHRAGGSAILEECRKIIARQGGCKTGEAVITGAGLLPARFVIHTVGPVWRGGENDEEKLMEACYINSLRIAIDNKCESIAFPNISTGIYGFPKAKAAKIAYNAVVEFYQQHHQPKKILFACFDQENYELLKAEQQS